MLRIMIFVLTPTVVQDREQFEHTQICPGPDRDLASILQDT
jgi:hypothetical protein